MRMIPSQQRKLRKSREMKMTNRNPFLMKKARTLRRMLSAITKT